MPRGDGTGPMGSGPRTGRGMGNCTRTPSSNNSNPRKSNSKVANWGSTRINEILLKRIGKIIYPNKKS